MTRREMFGALLGFLVGDSEVKSPQPNCTVGGLYVGGHFGEAPKPLDQVMKFEKDGKVWAIPIYDLAELTAHTKALKDCGGTRSLRKES